MIKPWLIFVLWLGMWVGTIFLIWITNRHSPEMRKKLREEERKRNRMPTPRLDDMKEIRNRRYKP